MADLMRAVCIHQYGGPDVLRYELLPRPEPAPAEVLVRVHAAGVNPVDWKTRSGSVPVKTEGNPFPLILGWDVSGVVEALGEGVTTFQTGDRVYGLIRFPRPGRTYAEYVAAPANQLALKPEAIDYLQAAALPLVSLTAWQALIEAAGLSSGETILIQAAAGGVGHVAIQIAKARGAHVVGTASASNRDFLGGLGVDTFIDYRSARFEEVVAGLDVVFDTLGGEDQERSWQVLREGGRLVSIRSGGDLAERAAAHHVHAAHVLVRRQKDHLDAITGLVASGLLCPHIAEVFPLEQAAVAHHHSEAGHTRGKLVLQVCW